jgi:hypothetical protein
LLPEPFEPIDYVLYFVGLADSLASEISQASVVECKHIDPDGTLTYFICYGLMQTDHINNHRSVESKDDQD